MNISENDDSDYAKAAEIVMAAFAEAGHPGSFLVDLFPSMRFIPAWFPGAGWKRKANYWRKVGEYFSRTPWDTVKEQLVWYISLILERALTLRAERRYSWTFYGIKSHRETTGWNLTWLHRRGDNGSKYMCNCFRWWVLSLSSKYKLCWKMSIGGADTVSHQEHTFYERYNIRRFQQSTHFSWQWPSTLRSRRRLNKSLTRLLVIVCPSSTIDKISHIWMPWRGSR